MMILAYLAIAVPVLCLIVTIIWAVTDGFTAWFEGIILIVAVACVASLIWGAIYIQSHGANLPVQAEAATP